jgi:hypothetical protein
MEQITQTGVIFKEIVPLKKTVFAHFNPHFITTVLFKPKG